ncbi:MAG: ABC transporter permease [Oscillospiraceae bacterium]|nr:ABC transporter permease [Oscillospiraceae bacterium]
MREPILRIARRDDLGRGVRWAIRGGSFVAAILLGAIIFLAIGNNPLSAYSTILSGSLGKATALRQTAKIAVPLLGTALAIAPCFKMRFWNIGAEGQITAGAVGATYFALFWYDSLPSPPLLVVMALAGAVLGGVWALIPAVFKAKWGTNETLFTLMMNYIIIGVVRYLQGGPWEGKPGSQVITQFDSAATLPKVLGVHCGWIIVLALTVAMFIYMKYSKHGYEISVIGESENTARYAGMNVPWIILRTAFLSGAISGLVGFIVVSGANYTLYDGVAAGVGFTAITVAWLAQLNPFAMVGISALLAVLEKGADTLQTRMSVPASISDIITGIFLFCMLGCEFFVNYRIILRGGKEAAEHE